LIHFITVIEDGSCLGLYENEFVKLSCMCRCDMLMGDEKDNVNELPFVGGTNNGAVQVEEDQRNVDVTIIRCVHIVAFFFFQIAVSRIRENEHFHAFMCISSEGSEGALEYSVIFSVGSERYSRWFRLITVMQDASCDVYHENECVYF
jgi:hypothetical protein